MGFLILTDFDKFGRKFGQIRQIQLEFQKNSIVCYVSFVHYAATQISYIE